MHCTAIHYCQLVHIRNICFEVYELDPAKKNSAPGLAFQGASEKAKVLEEEYVTLFVYMEKLIPNT